MRGSPAAPAPSAPFLLPRGRLQPAPRARVCRTHVPTLPAAPLLALFHFVAHPSIPVCVCARNPTRAHTCAAQASTRSFCCSQWVYVSAGMGAGRIGPVGGGAARGSWLRQRHGHVGVSSSYALIPNTCRHCNLGERRNCNKCKRRVSCEWRGPVSKETTSSVPMPITTQCCA